MAKLLKSFFNHDKRKSLKLEGDDEDFRPPLDDRRKLSISRSGRMRQNNKKRHSLSLDVYGQLNQPIEKPRSVEYHVNTTTKGKDTQTRRHSGDITMPNVSKPTEISTDINNTQIKTPEEEIESAFAVIDKISQ